MGYLGNFFLLEIWILFAKPIPGFVIIVLCFSTYPYKMFRPVFEI